MSFPGIDAFYIVARHRDNVQRNFSKSLDCDEREAVFRADDAASIHSLLLIKKNRRTLPLPNNLTKE